MLSNEQEKRNFKLYREQFWRIFAMWLFHPFLQHKTNEKIEYFRTKLSQTEQSEIPLKLLHFIATEQLFRRVHFGS